MMAQATEFPRISTTTRKESIVVMVTLAESDMIEECQCKFLNLLNKNIRMRQALRDDKKE